MPPHVPRKRLREESPNQTGQTPRKKGKSAVTAPPRKATLFDALDATVSPKTRGKAHQQLVESSDDDSSLTSLSDADFEEVVPVKQTNAGKQSAREDEDEDEDMEFEDVSYPTTLAPKQTTGLKDGALELTLSHIPTASFTDFGGKRGPSKNERRIRAVTHCMHVQFLMWHNSIRNSWLCDPTLQGIMLSHIPSGMWDEIERFRRTSGLQAREESSRHLTTGTSQGTGKGKAKGKGNVKKAAAKPARDWGGAAERLEKGAVDMSFGDPLFRLLKALSSWWRKRFRITASGLRKIGYMQTRRCTNLIKGFKQGRSDPKRYGEHISDLHWFRLRAQACAGSRDVGAQLFTALLRAIGLEARMVANLQPAGFGFTKFEEADEENQEDKADAMLVNTSGHADTAKKAASKSTKSSKKVSETKKQPPHSGRSLRQNGAKNLRLDSDDSEDDDLALRDDIDDDAVVEIPPLKLSKNAGSAKFDRDLDFPHYWTEVLSPATQKCVPVDAIVKNVVGTNRDLIESLEPRGAKADKAKQVAAYIVGFSDDQTAKDVTVRYMKNRMLPGRTKGVRMPLEKIPVYNKNGKVKRYDHFDWFKSVLRGYARGERESYPLTDIDYEEDSTDLKPAQPQKKEIKEGEETLQYYKQSKEFALARHLKREEALLPTAEPVKVFKIKRTKGKKGEDEEEPVYLRKDVVQVKSEETWHKQGRAPKRGAVALKSAPYRVATTNRRRELAELEAQTGHKAMQPLYSYDQTDWIIPPPIENGVIPKNQYGNIDLFVEHMLPKGAAHVPYRGAIRVCKRLEIDFAEAVVDFEFGHRMAVPVIQGVVIAEEHFDNVVEEVAKDEAEKKRKEDEKRRKLVLASWRRLLMGMRIRERIRKEYGDVEESNDVFGHSRDHQGQKGAHATDEPTGDEDLGGGGFLPEGYAEQDPEQDDEDHGGLQKSSFFFPVGNDEDEDEEDGANGDDDLVVDDWREPNPPVLSIPTAGESSGRPSSPHDVREVPPRRRTKRMVLSPSDDEENDEEGDEDMDLDDDYEE